MTSRGFLPALPALILHSLSSRSPAELLNTPYLAAYAAGSLAMLLLGLFLLFAIGAYWIASRAIAGEIKALEGAPE